MKTYSPHFYQQEPLRPKINTQQLTSAFDEWFFNSDHSIEIFGQPDHVAVDPVDYTTLLLFLHCSIISRMIPFVLFARKLELSLWKKWASDSTQTIRTELSYFCWFCWPLISFANHHWISMETGSDQGLLLLTYIRLTIDLTLADVLRMPTLNLKLDIGADVGVGVKHLSRALITALQHLCNSLTTVCSCKFKV